MAKSVDKLVFVFNADAGAFNAFLDSARKLLQINGCTLCSITHGLVGEKSDWRHCKEELGVPIEYIHRNEVTLELRRVIGESLPCVVADSGGDLTLLLTPEVLERCRGSVADLKGRLRYFASINQLSFPELISTSA
jgi:hypothetical protein